MEILKTSSDVFQKNTQWLIDNFEAGVYISDLDTYEILYMNKACRSLLNISAEADIEGLICYETINLQHQPCSFCTNQLLSEKRYYVWEHFNKQFKKHTILRDCLIQWDGRLCRLEIIIDISTSEKMEKVISTKIHVENMLLNCISTIIAGETVTGHDSLMPVLSTLGEFYHASRAYILEFNREAKVFRYSYQWVRPGISPDSSDRKLQLHGLNCLRQAYRERTAYLIRNIDNLKNIDPEEHQWQTQRGVRSLYGVPLVREGKLQGYLCVDNPNLNIGNYSLMRTLAVFVMNQLSQVKLYEKQRYEIYHDGLTGLLNRNSYVSFLTERPYGTEIGVVYVDINSLSKMNQDFGQAQGDQMVRQVARVLQNQFPGQNVFRFEGDEFIAICQNMEYYNFLQTIEEMERILDAAIPCGVSCGYTWNSDGDMKVDQMVYTAHQVMVVNKRKYYAQQNLSSRYNDVMILNHLQEEIKKGCYLVYLQPKMDIHTEHISGMEALIRYSDEEEGIVSPGRFVPLLEKEGLIRHIDFFVLRVVCQLLAKWRSKGYTLYPVSVNFSRTTIMENSVVEEIAAIVDSYAIPHDLVLIEITETMGDLGWDMFVAIGTKLQKRGFGVSLDDFCSQYSCVSLLASIPFAEVKFDRSMIKRIDKDRKMRLLCKAMMEASSNMECPVLAEGVETKVQLELLRRFKCDTVQGYYYSRPIPVSQFEATYF